MQVTFHNIAAGGEGVGRDESGRTVFALHAAPGDVAQVEIVEERPKFARGKIVRLETASPLRAEPACSYFSPQDDSAACGGCQLQHLAYAAQLEAKRNLVVDALTRLGGFENPPVEACVPSPLELGYRNKAELFVDGDAVGFHARRTHKVVDIESCPLLQDPLNELLAAARPLFELVRGVTGFSMRVDSRGARALQLEGAVQADDRKKFFIALREKIPNLIDPNQHALEDSVGDLTFHGGANEFFQINSSLTPKLLEIALEMAAVQPGENALDLFCGSGLFGVAMAKAGAKVTAVDLHGKPDTNARRNGTNLKFSRQSADRYLRRAKEKTETCDVALLDPPRVGAQGCMEPLAEMRPSRIVYVSCDPATLARDLKLLAERGYRLSRVVPLDMFPQTSHVETVVKMELV